MQGEMAGVHNGVGEAYAPFVRGAALCIARDGSTNLCFGSSSGSLYVSEVRGAAFVGVCSKFTRGDCQSLRTNVRFIVIMFS